MRNNNYSSRCLIISFFAISILQACSSSPTNSRYNQTQDSAPTFKYDAINAEEPTPTYVEYNVWTSRPYEIRGQYYTPMQTGKGYQANGNASWYGQKFHGHKTANGEVFDMFELTAAHKTLPLPSFVRVTNKQNNKTIVVRVNDRGPFHDNRIIDLSYAAAKKLDFRDNGVAPVHIEVIHVDESGLVTIGNKTQTQDKKNASVMVASAPSLPKVAKTILPVKKPNADPSAYERASGLFVQVMAMADGDKAKDLAKGIGDLLQQPTHIPKIENLYRLRIGPLENEQSATKVIKDLKNIGFDKAFAIDLSPK
ncbi:septal ring lytic transglycosylase RlpA family protein [Agaribacter marinus]|uniref:Endolytic peptidoglycan transglycosylase RlpA n=1 Tax=Agaribacter marinus TaxID=1431249 RepID=A0AA37T187_9ALTE|nr:septal ring lytic transglycosylase RlpA family protein [Agaribacter marinus]GLR70493.1 hypothetical protein GCM10007852_14010 [Agaribacter marinus]